jgi:hypothetical protein
MDVTRLKDLPEDDRKSVLEGEAIKVEDHQQYTRPLTEDEILFYKDELSQNSIQQAIMQDEFQKQKDAFKEQITPIRKAISTALEAIRFKAITCEGKLYKLADFEKQIIHIVDEHGNVVNTRIMLPEERQFRIQALKQQSA